LLHRASGGRIGNRFISGGAPVLFLTTVGRKSGKRRETPLIYLPDGDRYVVAASNAGAERSPAWFHNLMAADEAEARVGRETHRVHPRLSGGAERAELWPRLQEIYDGYAPYQAQAEREIPVVVLEPL
jgi:F420H(2)-dependent quinone reductase